MTRYHEHAPHEHARAVGKSHQGPQGFAFGQQQERACGQPVVQMNGSKNFVASTASTNAVAPSSGYPVAMTVGSPAYTV